MYSWYGDPGGHASQQTCYSHAPAPILILLFFCTTTSVRCFVVFFSIWAGHRLCFRSCSRGRACGDWGAFDVALKKHLADLFSLTQFLLIPFKQFVTELVSILNILSIKQRHQWMLMLSRLKWLLMYLLRYIFFCSLLWSWHHRSVSFSLTASSGWGNYSKSSAECLKIRNCNIVDRQHFTVSPQTSSNPLAANSIASSWAFSL